MKTKLSIYEEAAVRKVKREFGSLVDVDDWRVVFKDRLVNWQNHAQTAYGKLRELFPEYVILHHSLTLSFCIGNGKKCIHLSNEVAAHEDDEFIVRMVERYMQSPYSDEYMHNGGRRA